MASIQRCDGRWDRTGRVVLGLVGWCLAANLSTSAAPIKSAGHKHHSHPHPDTEFEAFLEGGPGHWATSHLMSVPDGVHVRNKHGELKNNLAVDYVMWVRDRHPNYFDRHHPT